MSNKVILMCLDAVKLNELCDFFPQTAENIRRRSMERRKRFMIERAKNSKRFD